MYEAADLAKSSIGCLLYILVVYLKITRHRSYETLRIIPLNTSVKINDDSYNVKYEIIYLNIITVLFILQYTEKITV
jgi:hypothetical protein